MGKRILGIDTGTNSLGWAVVERDDNGGYELLRRGSLIFQEGVKIEKGIESSKAAERTSHRVLRKMYFRRRLRKIEVLKVLIKYGMCPRLTDEQLNLWHTKKEYPLTDDLMLWQRTNDNEGKNPYHYRHICLHERLNLDEQEQRYMLGRALYHLAQRRGFMSNRLDQSEDNDESGKVKSSISELSKEMVEAGCEYLGDYFYMLYSEEGNKVRIRTRYTDREQHYKNEFYAICKTQCLTPEQVNELERALYFQRPLKSQRMGVGKCTFEPRKPRCADSHPSYEEYRMLSFLNNVKVRGPKDDYLRPLNEEERKKAMTTFFRKSKPSFDFEDIAKAIAGKGKYQFIKEEGDKPYKFNYRMSQGVTGCPTITQLKAVFGDDYESGIAELYTKNIKKDSMGKTPYEMVCDVWNVLYSFSDKANVMQWAYDHLQLNDEDAEKFASIKLSHNFASLSLCAINKILPWLRGGIIYSHAVFLAKVPDIIGKAYWERDKESLTNELLDIMANSDTRDRGMHSTIEFCIRDLLLERYNLRPGAVDKLYHPSMIDTYPEPRRNKQGVYQLGSPKTNAVRNPMAMRSLHELRKVVNMLLREKVIDENTEVHIEYARALNDANRRWAIAAWNKEQEKKRKNAYEEIKRIYREQTGKDIEPAEEDIKKFLMWEEQKHICLYTDNQIGIADFIGKDPHYDIEHTIPRSVGGESVMANMTLCQSNYNRYVKKAKMPSELPPSDYEAILVRIEPWKEKIEKLRKDADRLRTHGGMAKEVKDRIIQKRHLLRMELDYWQDKYNRFTLTEAPDGFARRQGAGIGLVGKYAGLYLRSLFHKPNDPKHSNVRVVKGATTAEFREMWGLQKEYEKKSRDNHIHHCIDAIVIACMEIGDYQRIAEYYQQQEEYERSEANKPSFPKPWKTFTEDLKALEKEMIVVHDTRDNMPKHAKKLVRTPKGKFLAKGDVARGSLHNDTYYGAIERDGEIRYVVRRQLSSFEKESDLDNIVDETVKAIIKQAVAERGFKEAMAGDIFMNKEKAIKIKKVRCYANSVRKPLNIRKQRDVSKKEYKQQFHVQNEGNYMMAIYEDIVKGKVKRDYELVKTIEASEFFKKSMDRADYPEIVPEKSEKGYPLKHKLRIGQFVLLYEKSCKEINFNDKADLTKRLYKITGLSYSPITPTLSYGVVVMRYHQEARMAKDVKIKKGAYSNDEELRPAISMLHTQFNALVEGEDFTINALGEIKLK